MSKILFPTDFSNNARNAFEYGLALFGTEHEFVMFNSYEEPRSTTASMVSLKDILAEASEDSLREEKAFLEQKFPSVTIETVSMYGDPVNTVTGYAQKIAADFIVMGTAGASGLTKLFLGSVAAAVIEKSNCPVFVVPKDYSYAGMENVLFTADLENEDDVELPGVLRSLIEKFSCHITVLTVNEEGKQIDMEKAEKGFALHMAMNGYDHKFASVTHDDVEEAIRTYAHDNDVQLLITTPRKSTWFDRLMHPSVSKELTEHLEVPMLALH